MAGKGALRGAEVDFLGRPGDGAEAAELAADLRLAVAGDSAVLHGLQVEDERGHGLWQQVAQLEHVIVSEKRGRFEKEGRLAPSSCLTISNGH